MDRINKTQELTNTGLLRIKSVNCSTAQSASMCSTGKHEEDTFFNTVNTFFSNSDAPEDVKAITWLLFQEGLRVSEVLNIRSQDILRNGNIVIRGLKGSNDRIVTPANYKWFWDKIQKNGIQVKECFNRYYIYRVCKKYGLSIELQNKSRKAVTHSFRHIVINELDKNEVSINAIQSHMGHKSTKSTKHYLNG